MISKTLASIGENKRNGKNCYPFDYWLIHRSSVKCEVVDTKTNTVPKPGVRYFFSEKTSKEQSWLSEIGAVVLSFCFAGIVPLLCVLFVVGWLSQRARSMFGWQCSTLEILILSFLTLLIPVKVYNRRALKLGMWKWLYEYFS